MSVRVRRIEARDKQAWLPLFKGYIEFYKATVPDDVIELTWQRLIKGAPDFHIGLVAVDEADVPLGLAHVLFHRSTWSPTHYCYLEDLFEAGPSVLANGHVDPVKVNPIAARYDIRYDEPTDAR